MSKVCISTVLAKKGSRFTLLVACLLVTVVLATAGCRSNSGSREYIPGQGWVPNG